MTEAEDVVRHDADLRECVEALVLAYCLLTNRAIPNNARLAEIAEQILALRLQVESDQKDELTRIIEALMLQPM